MNPGKRDTLLTIQRLTTSRGASGGAISAWADDDSLWAERVSATGTEFRAASARHAEVNQVFRVRYYAGLSPKSHRIIRDGLVYDILSAIEEKRFETMLVSCKYTEARA